MHPVPNGLFLFGAVALAGCTGKGAATGSTETLPGSGTPPGTPSTTTTTTVPSTVDAVFTWTDDGGVPTDTDGDTLPDTGCGDSLRIDIVDPLGMAAWSLGIAETTADGWTGEDCFNGWGAFQLCHTIGIAHTLDEVEDCRAISIVEGATTFLDASREANLTYYLEDSLGYCFVFGADITYYDTLGCDPPPLGD